MFNLVMLAAEQMAPGEAVGAVDWNAVVETGKTIAVVVMGLLMLLPTADEKTPWGRAINMAKKVGTFISVVLKILPQKKNSRNDYPWG